MVSLTKGIHVFALSLCRWIMQLVVNLHSFNMKQLICRHNVDIKIYNNFSSLQGNVHPHIVSDKCLQSDIAVLYGVLLYYNILLLYYYIIIYYIILYYTWQVCYSYCIQFWPF